MALAVAASAALPVSALMLTQALVLACGLATREPATLASTPSVRVCPECTASNATDSLRAEAVQLARSATRDGSWNVAAERWRDALLIDDRRGADWMALGDVLLQAARHREAAAAYERAIQVDPRLTAQATRGVARAYAQMGDDRQAVRWLEQALRLGARPTELWGDESFRRYRDTPRLQIELRRQIDRRGVGESLRAVATT